MKKKIKSNSVLNQLLFLIVLLIFIFVFDMYNNLHIVMRQSPNLYVCRTTEVLMLKDSVQHIKKHPLT